MSTTKVAIGDRLSALREELGYSQREMGEAVGISGQAWGKYERGKSTPSTSVLKLLVSDVGVNPFWLLTGQGEMLQSEGLTEASDNPLIIRDRDLAYQLEEAGISLCRIPQLRVEVSAGEGVKVYESDEIEEQEEWLSETFIRRQYHVQPQRVRTLPVRGSSMYDTIEPGDRIRVALWDGEPLWIDSIYVLHSPGGLVVKRYEGYRNGEVLLQADNPKVQDRHVPRDKWEEEWRPVAWALEVTKPL